MNVNKDKNTKDSTATAINKPQTPASPSSPNSRPQRAAQSSVNTMRTNRPGQRSRFSFSSQKPVGQTSPASTTPGTNTKTSSTNTFSNSRSGKSFSNFRKDRRRAPRANEISDEFSSHILHTRRVTKVVKGGKNMSFYVLSIVGNKKGTIGLGEGKSRTIVNAINKSFHNAKKNMFVVPTIRPVRYRFKATQIILKKNSGQQIITSDGLYNIFNLAGIRGVSCKIIASHNIVNVVKCLFSCLHSLKTEKENEDSAVQAQREKRE